MHEEIGQTLTAVLLGLKRILDRAPAELRDELRAVQDITRSMVTSDGQSRVLRVADDGRGMNGAAECAGIRGMRERAILISADLIGPSQAGGVEVPLAAPQHDRG